MQEAKLYQVVELPVADRILGMLIQYFVDGEDFKTAGKLLYCRLQVDEICEKPTEGQTHVTGYRFKLYAPRRLYDELSREDAFMETLSDRVRAAFAGIMKALNYDDDPTPEFVPDVADIGEDWRLQLGHAVSGKEAHNQAVEARRAVVWNNMRFQTAAELRIAQALEKAQALYLPNCKLSLGYTSREIREPDFLICHRGRWGILQILGDPFHENSTIPTDQDQDSLMREHGIRVIEYVDANDCIHNASAVVTDFLKILEAAY